MWLRKAVVLGDSLLAREMADDLRAAREMSVRLAAPAELAEPGALTAIVGAHNVVLNALPAEQALAALRATIEANRLIADAVTPASEASALHARAVEMEVAACVGCGRTGLEALLGREPVVASAAKDVDLKIAAWMATAWARRLLTGDFRGHWGVWTPERLGARAGMRHAIVQDLAERGIRLT